MPNSLIHGPSSLASGLEKLRVQIDGRAARLTPRQRTVHDGPLAAVFLLELAVELLVAALLFLPLLPRAAMEGEGKIVVLIAAVEVPEHRPRAVRKHLAERAIVVDHGLPAGHRHGDPPAFTVDDLGGRPAAEVFPIRRAEPLVLDVPEPARHVRRGLRRRTA